LIKTAKLTKYNVHCTKIRKIVCNIDVVRPSYEELQINRAMFMSVMTAYDAVQKVTVDKRSHKCYYPYLILKCFSLQWSSKTSAISQKKLAAVHDYVHMQSPETVRESDKMWAKICKVLGWDYHPTIL
jgi:hypothetical protein